MNNWHPETLYQLTLDRHREDIAHGEAAQRLNAALGSRPVRARLATALNALARRLDPARSVSRQEEAQLVPGTPV
jgi:hypothetical protein